VTNTNPHARPAAQPERATTDPNPRHCTQCGHDLDDHGRRLGCFVLVAEGTPDEGVCPCLVNDGRDD
jgi:hypothetical protein